MRPRGSRDLSDVDPGAVTHMYAFGQALANGSV